LLLASGGSVELGGDQGYAALNMSSKPDMLSLLLRNGSSPNASKNGSTALFEIAKSSGPGYFDDSLAEANARANDALASVKLLLAAGARVNTQVSNGETALIAAADAGTPGIVAALLSAGAEVNTLTKTGESALLKSASLRSRYCNYLKVAQYLIVAGADVNRADAKGRTPLSILRRRRAELGKDLVKLRPSSGGFGLPDPWGDDERADALRASTRDQYDMSAEMMKLLLQAGAH
jgi:ankyrin repeat protein